MQRTMDQVSDEKRRGYVFHQVIGLQGKMRTSAYQNKLSNHVFYSIFISCLFQFFELAASKGNSNIPVREPKLAQAAMEASAAAARRPRPTHKFKNSDTPPGAEQYYNGRKLSSGESPGNLACPTDTPREVPVGPVLEPSLSSARVHMDSFRMHQTPASATQHTQHHHIVPGRPPPVSMAPALSTELSGPPLFTPSTAGRHLSAALGLPTPSAVSGHSTRFPFLNQDKEGEHGIAAPTFPTSHLAEHLSNPRGENQYARLETTNALPQIDVANQEFGATVGGSAMSHSKGKAEAVLQESAVSSDGHANSGSQSKGPPHRSVARHRPNLKVAIPNPNREDFASSAPSGIHSMSSPLSGNESFRGLMSARLPGMTPTSLGGWGPWNPLTPADRDPVPVPLTPFLNYNLDGSGDGAQFGFGGTHHFSLPSPTNAGLLPLTPRIIGFDPLATSRAEGQSLLPSKRGIDHLFDHTDNQSNKRQQ